MLDSLSRVISKESKNRIKQVCVPIKATSYRELFRLAKRARQIGVRYLEIWLDSLPGDPILTLSKPQYAFLHPYIAVCKGAAEHGSFCDAEETRMDVLMTAAFSGADFVDIGIEADERLLRHVIARIKKSSKTRIILSYHNFRYTPSLPILLKLCKKSFALGADIVKIATSAKRHSDNVILFELAARLRMEKRKFIVLGMGGKGMLSRIGGVVLGGFLTYIALDEKKRTAPGQLIL